MNSMGRLAGPAKVSRSLHPCPLPRAFPASCLSRYSHSPKSAKLLPRQRLHSRVRNQATSNSQTSVTLKAPASPQQSAPQQKDLHIPRSILISIDYTKDSKEALQWALDFVVNPGDKVYLAHVICNPRAGSAEVGNAAGAFSRNPSFHEVEELRAYIKRLERAELDKLHRRFEPMLQAAGVSYEVKLPLHKGQKSAQAIGEALCQTAADLNAAVMIIASHGTGVLADYGSVASYCSQNSRAPVLMVPPNVASLQTKQPGKLMVVALADMAGLQKVASFTLNNLYKPGDKIHTTFVEDTASSEEAVPSQHRLSENMEEAAKEWFSAGPHDKVDFEVNLMVAPGPLESSDLDLGEEICTKADQLEARTVVLLHHGKSLMKEMVFGSITSFATRNCRRPLVVYYP